MPDAVVFGPEPDCSSTEERLAAEFESAVTVLRPYADAAAQLAAAFMSSLQPTIDGFNQLARALTPVVEARAEMVPADHREYHRRALARQRRRR